MVMHIVAKSSTCVAAKIADLVVARAGVGDSFGAVWEHQDAAAGSLALDAGADGALEGLSTVCQYVASKAADPGALLGRTPEEEALVQEWLSRASSEYAVDGVVADDRLEALDAYLLTRSFLATPGDISLADILAYGTVHASVVALPPDVLARRCNLARWCDHVGRVTGGDGVFGAVPVRRESEFELPPAPPPVDKKARERAGPKKGDGDKKEKKGGDDGGEGKSGVGGESRIRGRAAATGRRP